MATSMRKLDSGVAKSVPRIRIGRKGVLMGTDEELKELEKIMQLISDPGSRRYFLQDPEKALEGKGVARSDKLQRVIDALADLSPAELRVVASLNKTMLEAGFKHPGSDIISEAV
jgi:hypothetical protein